MSMTGVSSLSVAMDLRQLQQWLDQHCAGFDGPLTIEQMPGGRSNPTFKLKSCDQFFVLRRKPPGILLKSAHAVEREFRVISALNSVSFPTPEALALCEDEGVIGSAFYVMEFVDGRILFDGPLPSCPVAERRDMYLDLVRVLARLHLIKPDQVGLSDFGRPGNYFTRQIHRWTQQYEASRTAPIPHMSKLATWLADTVIDDGDVTIVHGDYRLDNVVYHREQSNIIAVLDWEISTLGNPLADISNLLMNWVLPTDEVNRAGLADIDFALNNIPTMADCAAEYCRMTGRESLPTLDWLLAYNMFRLTCIFQGVVRRAHDGAAGLDPAPIEARIPAFAGLAWKYAQRAGA